MSCILGIDTSNYTTSAALFADGRIVVNAKLLVKVADGARGIRQSDAVFAHVKNLPSVIAEVGAQKLDAVAYSAFPRDCEGSYMPCFLAGKAAAAAIAETNGIPAFPVSHQAGHIAAAVYSSGHDELYGSPFLAFHVSGGTTDLLLVDGEDKIKRVGGTLDLNAGQAIDRAGVLLGLNFPCGPELERLCGDRNPVKCGKISVNGCECNLSGLENKVKEQLDAGVSPENIAIFVISFIIKTLDGITSAALEKYGSLPLLFAGGVMSNRIIREYFTAKYGAYFAEPAFSCDNAAGVACLGAKKYAGTVRA